MFALPYVILIIGWLAWVVPFFLVKRSKQQASKIDSRARWGILLQIVGFSIVWQGSFWKQSPELWQVALSIIFLALAALFSWTAVRTLGKQWRIDAGLNPDHELVRAGPYRFVRHPIYTSMLCLLLGTGFVISTWPLLIAGTAIFLIGLIIRVRIEDSLLVSRFGDQFREYQRSVPSIVPKFHFF